MNDDSWLVSKQAQFLEDVVKAWHISAELMECLSILTKQTLTGTEKMELAKRYPTIPRLAGKALELIRQGEEMMGTLKQEGHEIDAMMNHNDLTNATSVSSIELDYPKPIVRSLPTKRKFTDEEPNTNVTAPVSQRLYRGVTSGNRNGELSWSGRSSKLHF